MNREPLNGGSGKHPIANREGIMEITRTRKIVVWSWALLMSAFVMSGCATSNGASTSGGGNSTASQSQSSGARTSDACTLLTKDEASTAMGADAGSPTASDATSCSYLSTVGVVSLGIAPGAVLDFNASCGLVKSAAGAAGSLYQDISGVGDTACGFTTPTSGQVHLKKGSTVADINLSGASGVGDRLITLAKAIAGRL